MPAVCRFYLKGYCRFGSNCKFEHPGEVTAATKSSFSFTKALEEVTTTTSPPPSQGFSFTRALETAVNQQHQNSPYHYGAVNNQNQNYYNNSYNTQYNHSYEPSPFRQQYNTSNFNNNYNNSTSGFSFSQALNATTGQPQSTSFYNTNLTTSTASPFKQPTSGVFGASNADVEIEMRGGEHQGAQVKDIQLTELEIKAYRSDKFTFRLIPIRPPPPELCY